MDYSMFSDWNAMDHPSSTANANVPNQGHEHMAALDDVQLPPAAAPSGDAEMYGVAEEDGRYLADRHMGPGFPFETCAMQENAFYASGASSKASAAILNTPQGTTEFTRRRNWATNLLQNLPTWLLCLSPTSNILYSSPASRHLLGYAPGDMLGKRFGEYLHVDDVDTFLREFYRCMATLGHGVAQAPHSTMPESRMFLRFKAKDDRFVVLELTAKAFVPAMPPTPEENVGSTTALKDTPRLPTAFFIAARNYPVKITAVFDQFLELRAENEALKKRIGQLLAAGYGNGSTSQGSTMDTFAQMADVSFSTALRNENAYLDGTAAPSSSSLDEAARRHLMTEYNRIHGENHVVGNQEDMFMAASSPNLPLSMNTRNYSGYEDANMSVAFGNRPSGMESLAGGAIHEGGAHIRKKQRPSLTGTLPSSAACDPVNPTHHQDTVFFDTNMVNAATYESDPMLFSTAYMEPVTTDSEQMMESFLSGPMDVSITPPLRRNSSFSSRQAPAFHFPLQGMSVMAASSGHSASRESSGSVPSATAKPTRKRSSTSPKSSRAPSSLSPPASAMPSSSMISSSGAASPTRVCTDCGTTESPEWRKGPSGPKTLCNACGLRYAKKVRKDQQSQQGEST